MVTGNITKKYLFKALLPDNGVVGTQLNNCLSMLILIHYEKTW